MMPLGLVLLNDIEPLRFVLCCVTLPPCRVLPDKSSVLPPCLVAPSYVRPLRAVQRS